MMDLPPEAPPIISFPTNQCPLIAEDGGVPQPLCIIPLTGTRSDLETAWSMIEKEGWRGMTSPAGSETKLFILLVGAPAERAKDLMKRIAMGDFGPVKPFFFKRVPKPGEPNAQVH